MADTLTHIKIIGVDMKDRRKIKRTIDNRRNNNRVIAELDVTTFIDDQEYVTIMRNISGNGMQIVEPSDIEIKPQQECQILIKDENTMIKLEASVVWKDFGLIGLCFQKQNQKVQKQLNKLSQKLMMAPVTEKGMVGLA